MTFFNRPPKPGVEKRAPTRVEKTAAVETAETAPNVITLPHADAAITLYKEYLAGQSAKAERAQEDAAELQEVFNTYVEQALARTEVYESKELGVSFPSSSVNIAELAKALYKKKTGEDSEINEARMPRETLAQKKFVFGSALGPADGDPFMFAEETMHEIVTRLPQALKDLQEGREPEPFEVYTAGMPTNTLGHISPEFLAQIQADPVDAMSDMYAEFMQSKLPETNTTPSDVQQIVQIYGISMGAGFSARAGEKLLERGQATQDFKQAQTKHLPYLQIKAMVPVSLSESDTKRQIYPGFVADGAYNMFTNPAVKKIGAGIPAFQKAASSALAKKNIHEQMENGEKERKSEALKKIIFNLHHEISLNPDTKITTVSGLYDLTSYTSECNLRAIDHRESTDGSSLGRALVSNTTGEHTNRRDFSAEMGHTIPFFRESEFRRMEATAKSMQNLRNTERAA